MQREERYKVEKNKRKDYVYEGFFKRNENSYNNIVKNDLNNNYNITSMQVIKKDNFIVKLFNKIKELFRKK